MIISEYLPKAEIFAFGSRVKEQPHRYSDLDLLIKSEGAIPLTTLTKLSDKFSESLLPFKVDLIDWYRISSEFRQEIRKEKQQIL